MINQIQMQDFRSHRDTLIEPGRLTVLVGPNGCGKSSVLSAVWLISRLRSEGVGQVFEGSWSPRHLVRFGASGFELSLASDAGVFRLGMQREQGVTLSGLPAAVPSAAFLQLDSRRLAAPTPPTAAPVIAPDGAGLSAVIAEMFLSEPERIEKILAGLRAVIPQFQRLRIRQIQHNGAVHFELLADLVGAKGVPAHAISEGTLIAIGLLTALHSASHPEVVLIDDIDQGLHPRAQWELIAILRSLLEANPDLQIIASTHSPYLVDELRPEEVWLMALDQGGISRCKRMTAHPRAAELLGVLSTGEFLGSEGEDWVLEAHG